MPQNNQLATLDIVRTPNKARLIEKIAPGKSSCAVSARAAPIPAGNLLSTISRPGSPLEEIDFPVGTLGMFYR